MLSIDRRILLNCLRQLCLFLVRFCLKHSVNFQELEEILRKAYLEEASEEIIREGEKISDSRLSIITGLSRREVQRLRQSGLEAQSSPGLIYKVIGLWQNNSKFLSGSKKPKPLSYGFEKSEFNKLVYMVSKDLNAATVLFELERVNAIKKEGELISLIAHSYIPKGDAALGFSILSKDLTELTEIVEENVFFKPALANLHLKTSYDRIRKNGVMEIKKWLLKEGHDFHARARAFISQFDQDVNPDLQYNEDFTQVTLGTFGRASKD